MLLEKKKGGREKGEISGSSFERHRHTHTAFQFWGQLESEILPPNFKLKVVWQERTMEKLLISPRSH